MARTKSNPRMKTIGQRPATQQQQPQQAQTPTPAPQPPQQLNREIEDEVVFLGIRRPGIEGLFQEPLPRRTQTTN